MQVLQCALSGLAPSEPVLCSKTGLVFESSLVEPLVRANGACPVSKVPVDFDTDFIKIRALKYMTQGGFQQSVPECVTAIKEQVEQQVNEAVKLKAEAAELKSKLRSALTRQTARVEVIRKLVSERDALRSKLAQGSSSKMVNELMEQYSNPDADFNWKSSLYQKSEQFEMQKDNIFGNQTAYLHQESEDRQKANAQPDHSSILEKLKKEISSQIEANSLRLNKVRKQVAISKPADPYLTTLTKTPKLQVSLKAALKGTKGEPQLVGYHPNNPELAILLVGDQLLAVDLSAPEEGPSSSSRAATPQIFKVGVSAHLPNDKLPGRRVAPQILSKFSFDEYSFGLAVVSDKTVDFWEVRLNSEDPAASKSRKLFDVSFPQPVAQIAVHPVERLLLVSHGDNISLVDLPSRSIAQTFHLPLGEVERGEEAEATSTSHHLWLECHPDGTLVAWTTSNRPNIFGLVNIATGEIATELDTSVVFADKHDRASAKFSENGFLFAVSSGASTEIWDLRECEVLATIKHQAADEKLVGFSQIGHAVGFIQSGKLSWHAVKDGQSHSCFTVQPSKDTVDDAVVHQFEDQILTFSNASCTLTHF